MIDITKLEEILEEELKIYQDIEKGVIEKKEVLIKGDMEKLAQIDVELENHAGLVKKLEAQRIELSNNKNLNTLFESYKAQNVEITKALTLKEKIEIMAKNIKKINDINAELIKHSLQLVESSIGIIIKALVPEINAYDSMGKKGKNKNFIMSSVVQDV